MTALQANVPDYLAAIAADAAAREHINPIVALALSAQLAAWKIRDDMETRASADAPKTYATSSPKRPTGRH